jgi:hypothetical protein
VMGAWNAAIARHAADRYSLPPEIEGRTLHADCFVAPLVVVGECGEDRGAVAGE